MSIDVYRLGSSYVLVETGQPQDNVLLGFGDTPAEAYEDRQLTLMQSLGPDCGRSDALEWAVVQGWLDPEDLEALALIEEDWLPEREDSP